MNELHREKTNPLTHEYDWREKSKNTEGRELYCTNKEKIQRARITNKHDKIKSICNEKLH